MILSSFLSALITGIICYDIYINHVNSNITDEIYRIDLPEEYPEITKNDTLIAHRVDNVIIFEFLVAKRNQFKCK